jgi:hypothetical protein
MKLVDLTRKFDPDDLELLPERLRRFAAPARVVAMVDDDTVRA